jgi:hypothetical protein
VSVGKLCEKGFEHEPSLQRAPLELVDLGVQRTVVALEEVRVDALACGLQLRSAALSRAADHIGIIHGQRDAKVDAQCVWLLTAQRQQ